MTYDQALRELTRLLGVSRAELEPLLRTIVLRMPLRAEDGADTSRWKTLGQLTLPPKVHCSEEQVSRYWRSDIGYTNPPIS